MQNCSTLKWSKRFPLLKPKSIYFVRWIDSIFLPCFIIWHDSQIPKSFLMLCFFKYQKSLLLSEFSICFALVSKVKFLKSFKQIFTLSCAPSHTVSIHSWSFKFLKSFLTHFFWYFLATCQNTKNRRKKLRAENSTSLNGCDFFLPFTIRSENFLITF